MVSWVNTGASIQSKFTAAILLSVSLISIFAMLHHPSISYENVREQIVKSSDLANVNASVHWVLIFFIMAINLCLTYYAKARSFQQTRVLYGLSTYWVGTTIMVFAALLDGIVGPKLAIAYAQANEAQYEIYKGVSLLAREINLACAYFSFVCWLSSIGFLSFTTRLSLTVSFLFSLFSVFTSIAMIISLVIGWLTLSVHDATLIFTFICLWQIGVACMLYFNKVSQG